MAKVLMIVAGLLVVVVLGVVGAASMQPDVLHVERSITVGASPADLSPYFTDLGNFGKWSPWEKKDPTMKQTYSDTKSGVGAWYEWTGNDQVGHGKLVVTSIAPEKVEQDLQFFSPWESKALITFSMAPAGDDTKVTWAMDQPNDFAGKMAGLFMDMDAMLGKDFDDGLGALKPLAERDAIARKEAEAAAAAAALPPVDPEAPAAVPPATP